MTYLGRPVLNLHPDFTSPALAHEDEGSRQRRGFGRVTPWRTQPHTQRLYKLRFTLDSRELIRSFQSFFDDLRGNANGFWIPTWDCDYELSADVSNASSNVLISPSGLPENITKHPGLEHVCFITRDWDIFPHKVTSATTLSPDDSLTITPPTSQAFSRKTILSQLLYVRLVDDYIELKHASDTIAFTEIQLLELPSEYATAEQGTRPVWLYEVIQGSNTWHWTSHGSKLTINSIDWLPEDVIHSEIKKTTEFLDEGVSLDVGVTSIKNPFRAYLAQAAPTPVSVKIFQTSFPSLTLNPSQPIYEADVSKVSFLSGGRIKVELSSLLNIGQRKTPRFLMSRLCNWTLYEPNTCRVNMASYTTNGTISAIGSNFVEATQWGLLATNYLSMGQLTFGSETRLITQHTGNRLYLNTPFFQTPAIGDVMAARPGCSRTRQECKSKFNNIANFGAFPWLPDENPALRARRIPDKGNNSGKKG